MSTAGSYRGRHWFKSSYSRSTSNCVEISLGWTKSSFSRSSSNCVEIAQHSDTVLIRDSKYTGLTADQPIISISAAAWPVLLDLALTMSSGTVRDTVTVTMHSDGGATLRDDRGVELAYTPAEWDAFAKGVADGQFTYP